MHNDCWGIASGGGDPGNIRSGRSETLLQVNVHERPTTQQDPLVAEGGTHSAAQAESDTSCGGKEEDEAKPREQEPQRTQVNEDSKVVMEGGAFTAGRLATKAVGGEPLDCGGKGVGLAFGVPLRWTVR